MKKLLYIHTAEKVKRNSQGKYYTDGTYDGEVWKRYLDFFDNEITFLATMDTNIYEDEEIENKYNTIPDKVKVVTLENITSSIVRFFNPKIRKQRKKIIKKLVEDADAVIIRGNCDNAIKYAKKYSKPYIIEVVGCVWDALWNYNFKGKILAPLSFYNMKKNIKNSKYAIYVTNEFLQKRYPTKGKNTNCSDVVLEPMENNVLEKRKTKIQKNKEKIVLGTSAAIDVKYKGQENVIKVLPKLIKKGYNIEYQLIGNGSKDRLEKIAKKYGVLNNVKFIGSIPHHKVFEWLENIDIYIQPSKQEGLPRALVEAMSKACPAVGTKIAGIPELLDKDFIYSKNNLKQLEEKITILISDNKYILQQAEKNFEKAKEYSVEKINKRRERFYKQFKKENQLI